MDPLAAWKKLLIGVIGQSRNAQKNWPAVFIPAVVVVIFVILLLNLV